MHDYGGSRSEGMVTTFLSSTPTASFFHSIKEGASTKVLIKHLKAEDSSEDTRIKALISYTELLTKPLGVLGTMSGVHNKEEAIIVNYAIDSTVNIQPLLDYLNMVRTLPTRRVGRSTVGNRPASNQPVGGRSGSIRHKGNRASNAAATAVASDLVSSAISGMTPRWSRRSKQQRSVSTASAILATSAIKGVRIEQWSRLFKRVDSLEELVIWQVVAQVVRGLLSFHSLPASSRACLVSNPFPGALFIFTDPESLNLLDNTVLDQMHVSLFAPIIDIQPDTPDPIYTAPEVFSTHHRTEKSDVWALGCLVFELVARRRPRFQSSKLVRNPVVQNIDCSIEMHALITACLKVDASARPSLAELADTDILSICMAQHPLSSDESTCTKESDYSTSELTLIKQLDLTTINVRPVARHKQANAVHCDDFVSILHQSESSDSTSLADLISSTKYKRKPSLSQQYLLRQHQIPLRSSDKANSAHLAGNKPCKLECPYYDPEARAEVLGHQCTTVEYPTIPTISPMLNAYISRRAALSFLLSDEGLNLVSFEAPCIVPLLGSPDSIKQLCNLSFDCIAVEPDRVFTPAEEAQLKGNLELVWKAIFSIKGLSEKILQSSYFFDRLSDTLDMCHLWVIEQRNPVSGVHEELSNLHIILTNLAECSISAMNIHFMTRYEDLKRLLGVAFDTKLNSFIRSLLMGHFVAPFVLLEVHQYFNNTLLSMVKELPSLDMSSKHVPYGHVLLLSNLSVSLTIAVVPFIKLTAEPYDLEIGILGIQTLLSRGVLFKGLLNNLTTYILTLLSLSIQREVRDGVYDDKSTMNVALLKLCNVARIELESLLAQCSVSERQVQHNNIVSCLNLLWFTIQVFFVLPNVQLCSLRDVGVKTKPYLNVLNCDTESSNAALGTELAVALTTDQSVPLGVYASQFPTSQTGLSILQIWNQSLSSFSAAACACFVHLHKVLYDFSQELYQHINVLNTLKEFSSVPLIQLHISKLRNIFLSLEACTQARISSDHINNIGQSLQQTGAIKRMQCYQTLFTDKCAANGISSIAFRRMHFEVPYLLASARVLLQLHMGESDIVSLLERRRTNLQGLFGTHMAQYKKKVLQWMKSHKCSCTEIVGTFICTFS